MVICNSSENYNNVAVRQVNFAHQCAPMLTVEANNLHSALLNSENTFFMPFHNDQIEAHLPGLFAKMTGKEGMTLDNVTVEDARNIADRFSVDGKRYDIRGDQITEDNYMRVLAEIAIRSSLCLSACSKTPIVGFLDANNEPLVVTSDAFVPEPPRKSPEPKRPNMFQRFCNKHFGWFKETHERYERTKALNDKTYRNELSEYENRMNLFEARYKEMEIMSESLKGSVERNIENTAPTAAARQLDPSVALEAIGNKLRVTNTVEATAVLDKIKENN